MKKYFTSKLLNKKEVININNIFKNANAEIRFVGGCVRNIILNQKFSDIDCATNIKPEKIIKILKKNNIKYNDYAKKYGSITAFINSQKFEITSLRKDINQQGRYTDIVFTKNWKLDAKRRDFTINALYLTNEGKIIDYFNGIKHLKEKKIKFIGNIDHRINEDFLRIYRYYRFLGIFKYPNIIKRYEKILNKYCDHSFKNLSNEIIRNEILKMLKNPFPLNSFAKLLDHNEKNYWLEKTTEHFVKTNYKLGLKKCLNKVNYFFD